MLTSDTQNLQIQPTKAKIPLPRVPIRTLEIRTASLDIGRDVPTAAALVGDQGQVVVVRYLLNEGGIGLDGMQTVGDREGRATKGGEGSGEGGFCGGEVEGGEGGGEGHCALYCGTI